MIRYSFILMCVCICAALVLSVTNKFTEPRIEAQVLEEEMLALQEIFSDADDFQKAEIEGQEYYQAIAKGELIGYIITVVAKGYAADIDMRVGVSLDGAIQGIKVLSQSETPGLGARVTEIKQGEEKPWFLCQFKGKNPDSLSLETIDAITAATITSEAVIDAVKTEVGEFLTKVQ
ncbi:FMN-binding protein [Candidatus Omnitrophota bacterium]